MVQLLHMYITTGKTINLTVFQVASYLMFKHLGQSNYGNVNYTLFSFILETDNHSVQFNSISESCPNLCDPMDCSTPGLPVHHQLPEFTQTQGTV